MDKVAMLAIDYDDSRVRATHKREGEVRVAQLPGLLTTWPFNEGFWWRDMNELITAWSLIGRVEPMWTKSKKVYKTRQEIKRNK